MPYNNSALDDGSHLTDIVVCTVEFKMNGLSTSLHILWPCASFFQHCLLFSSSLFMSSLNVKSTFANRAPYSHLIQITIACLYFMCYGAYTFAKNMSRNIRLIRAEQNSLEDHDRRHSSKVNYVVIRYSQHLMPFNSLIRVLH